jgi:hypothetical protein
MVDFLCSKISSFDVRRIQPIPKSSKIKVEIGFWLHSNKIHLTWTCILVWDLYAAFTFDARHAHRVWPAFQCDAPRNGKSGAQQPPYNRAVAAAPRGSRCAPPSVGRGGGRSGGRQIV